MHGLSFANILYVFISVLAYGIARGFGLGPHCVRVRVRMRLCFCEDTPLLRDYDGLIATLHHYLTF